MEFSRSKVVANSSIGCAVGLHAGTHEYASGFAQGKLVLVKINPRDVVSVPTDCDAQKLRVCRYEVLEEVQEKVDRVLWDIEPIEEDFDPEYDEDESVLWDDEDDDWGPDDDWSDDEDEDDVEEDDPYRHLRSFL